MKNSATFSAALLLSLFTLSAAAQEHQHGSMQHAAATTPLAGRVVTFASSPGDGSGYLSLPREKGKRPAIIVIQEWWGVNDWVKQQADRFAGAGYVALAADLYRGKVADEPSLAHELMRGMPEDRAMNDLRGAFSYLAARPDVDGTRIGVVGWCMGGGYALQLGLAEPRIAAISINYGRLVTDRAAIASVKAPILGNFGRNDRGIPPADVEAFGAALKKAGKQADIKIYDGAGHGFMNPNNKEGYAAAAAADAQGRIDGFFARHLRR